MLLICTSIALAAGRSGVLAVEASEGGDGLPQAIAVSSQETPPIKGDAEIIVTAKRHGEAPFSSETEFAQSDIAAVGADNIGELLNRLRPFIDPNGSGSTLLINGKPARFDQSILSFPPEALNRVAVLNMEANSHYGAAAGQRVVNLMLKKSFASIELDSGVNFPTAGGRLGESVGTGAFAITGDTRWTVRLMFDGATALRKSSRHIPMSNNSMDSNIKHVAITETQLRQKNEREVRDFLSDPTPPNPIDLDEFITLLPSRRDVTFNMSVTRQIGAFSNSLSLNAGRGTSSGMSGLAMSASPPLREDYWLPSGRGVSLYQQSNFARPLENINHQNFESISVTANGSIYNINSSISIDYSINSQSSFVQNIVYNRHTEGSKVLSDFYYNKYLEMSDSYINTYNIKASSRTINARLNLQRDFLKLPAGSISWSLAATAGRAQSSSKQSTSGEVMLSNFRSVSARANTQLSLGIPISRPSSKFAMLGNLAVDFSLVRTWAGGAGAQTGRSVGMTWAPISQIQFRGSIQSASSFLSLERLAKPISAIISRVFDYKSQQMVDARWITGGGLQSGNMKGQQNITSLGMTILPLRHSEMAFNVNYSQTFSDGGLVNFPDLTPDVEAAFPERIVRDSGGRLIEVDARPVSIDHDLNESLNSSFTLRLDGRRNQKNALSRAALIQDSIRFGISFEHRYLINSKTIVRRGHLSIDRLNGNGASKHTFDAQVNIGKRKLGTNMNVTWGSSSTIDSDFVRYFVKPPIRFSISTFLEADDLLAPLLGKNVASQLKFTFAINNILNGVRRVRLADGTVPEGYSRYEIDPLGRELSVTLKKRF